MKTTRRDFIKFISISIAAAFFPFPVLADEIDIDKRIFLEKIIYAKSKGLFEKPVNEIILETAISFIDTPYVGDTLDLTGNEALVTNLHGLDCWTFFENSLAIGRVIKKRKEKATFEDYKSELESIRYRDKIRKGYASRLHYIIDWLDDNSKKKVVKDMAKELGGVKLNKTINFMTSHREYYPPLSDENTFLEMKIAEENINSRDHYYIPTDHLPDVESKLKSADIFAFLTGLEGLDASHTGFIYMEGGRAYILDAASSVGYVSLSNETLYDYLSSSGISGIFLARPVET